MTNRGAPPPPSYAMSTPRALRLFIAVIALLATGLGVFLTAAAMGIGYGLRAIGDQTGPDAVAAADAAVALNDMDRQLATILLGHRTDDAELRERGEAAFASARLTASREIQKAGGNNARLIEALAEYEELAGHARHLMEEAPKGRAPTGKYATAFREANGYFRVTLRPVADKLIKDRQRGAVGPGAAGPVAWTLLLGALLLATLIALQWFLDRRTHRMFNPPLLIATLVITILVTFAAGLFGQAQADQERAAREGVARLLALASTTQLSFGTHADLIRSAADPGFGGGYEQGFLEKSQKLLHVGDASSEDYATRLPRRAGSVPGHGGVIPGLLRGFSPAEVERLQRAMYSEYRGYQEQATWVQEKLADKDTGATRAVTGETFEDYDRALAALSTAERASFFDDLRSAQEGMLYWPFIPGFVLLAALGIGLLGVWPRLAEYR